MVRREAASTGIFNWRNHLDLPANGGALMMNYKAPHPEDNASVVFTGLLDGRFAAFDGKSGKLLWQYDRRGDLGSARDVRGEW